MSIYSFAAKGKRQAFKKECLVYKWHNCCYECEFELH